MFFFKDGIEIKLPTNVDVPLNTEIRPNKHEINKSELTEAIQHIEY